MQTFKKLPIQVPKMKATIALNINYASSFKLIS